MNKEPKKQNKKRNIRDDRVKFLTGLFFFFFAIYLILSFVSFFFTWKSDQSFEWGQVMSNSSIIVENWAGKLGARLSNLFIAKWFGVSAFAFPFILIVVAFKLFNIRLLPVKKTIIYAITGMILLSLFLGFLTGSMDGYLVNGLGGSHGLYISDWFNSLIGKTGTAFLYIILLFAYILSVTKKTLSQIRSELGKVFTKQFIKNLFSRNFQKTESNEEPASEEEDNEGFSFVNNIKKENSEDTKTTDGNEATKTSETPREKTEEKEDIKLTIEKSEADNGTDYKNTQTIPDYDPTLELSHFEMPPVELLE